MKGCVFCGAAADRLYVETTYPAPVGDGTLCGTVCDVCGARGPLEASLAEAEAAWDKRPRELSVLAIGMALGVLLATVLLAGSARSTSARWSRAMEDSTRELEAVESAAYERGLQAGLDRAEAARLTAEEGR